MNLENIPFAVETPASYGFDQEYHILPKKKRGRPKMTEQFWYDPDEYWIIIDPEHGTFSLGGLLVWDNNTLTISGTIIK